MAQGMTVNKQGPEEREKELKTSRYDYNQGKNQGSNSKSQGVSLKT